MSVFHKSLRVVRHLRYLSTFSVYQAGKRSNLIRYVSSGVLLGGALTCYISTKKVSAKSSGVDISKFMAEPVTGLDTLEKDADNIRVKMEMMIMRVQGEFCRALEDADGEKKFVVERWQRPEGGGGVTCVMQDGPVFEKAGVNVSVVHGTLPPAATQQMRARSVAAGTGKKFGDGPVPFFAAGISSVVHPRNPNVPTIHFNYRYFEVDDGSGEKTWWFGGGTDLTPYFLDEQDVKHFHSTLKAACDKGDSTYYSRFKKWCDDYFYIKHRGESRGVGGIFFDDMDQKKPEVLLKFVTTCADAVIPSYLPIVNRHKNDGYSYADRKWQLLRRGRYVEFNLVYDRGTKFGLFTPGARIESILMSLPNVAGWQYSHVPEEGSKEAKLMDVLKNPRDWV